MKKSRNRYFFLDFEEPPTTVCPGVYQACSKIGVACIWSPKDYIPAGSRDILIQTF